MLQSEHREQRADKKERPRQMIEVYGDVKYKRVVESTCRTTET